jgi:hypothetical protein
MDLGSTSRITCAASDPDGDTLSFAWSSAAGSISGNDSVIHWTAPAAAGNYYVACRVADGHGGEVTDSIGLEVRDLSQAQTGHLIVYLTFDGDASDASGYNNNGVVHGASLALDHVGHINSAYSFNGTTSYIQVANSSNLNFQQAISVSFWMYIGAFYTREQYPLSHGNYQSRWKISISNNHLRWTVKTGVGIKDLDSETELKLNSWYHVTVVYSGSDFEVWLNGYLDAFTSWSGTIPTTTIDLTIGQVLPGDQNYNFNGSLDDIRIYDYALSINQIDSLAGVTTVEDRANTVLPAEYFLQQNYPNPFNPSTRIEYSLPQRTAVTLAIYDVLGREVALLIHETQDAGFKSITWNTNGIPSGVYFYRLSTPLFQSTKKLVILK